MKPHKKRPVETVQPEQEGNPEQIAPVQKPYRVIDGLQSVVWIAIVMATLLTLWNPRKVLRTPTVAELFQMESQTGKFSIADATVEENDEIGILAGFWQDGSGDVCSDGLLEVDVNYDVAERTIEKLEREGYQTRLFPEFDLDLINFNGQALVAVYAGSCLEKPLPPSQFKVITGIEIKNPDKVNALAVCLAENYQKATQLPFAYAVITEDHPQYHIFRDVDPNTPAVMIEVGSLSTNRDLISKQRDAIAQGIYDGIVCYLEQTSAGLRP